MRTTNLFLLLLVSGMLAGGCASVKSERAAVPLDGATAGPAADKRLPFPSAERASPTETNVVGYATYHDPLIWLNRAMFACNDVAYRFALIPASKAYRWAVPDPVEECVGNFFDNIRTPIVFANHLLQIEPKRAGSDLLSFCINTTVGLAGLFDPATAWFGIDSEVTHVSDTLADYSVGYGIYVVLPLFGPSDLRSTTSLAAEAFASPIPYLVDRPAATAIQGFDSFQAFAPTADDYITLRRKADDPYIFFRNLHLQGVQRDAEY